MTPVRRMLEARSMALVGASPRPGSLGERMLAQARLSPAAPRLYLVNPRHRQIAGQTCHPSLADLPGPVDLVLLGVGDPALEGQLSLAAQRGDRSAVIFAGAHDQPGHQPGLRQRLAGIAKDAGMALCGAGCMGFVNVSHGLRAVGYVEPDPLPAGPVALISHSGSVFSAMLRTRRRIGFTIAVSSGQELVTSAAAYAEYALSLPRTRVLALVLEAMREAGLLREVLAGAAAADIPVVLLTAGSSEAGRAMVTAHSGALAGRDGGWEALADTYGVHRVHDLAELADSLVLFAAGRRAVLPPGRSAAGTGIATVHDSGLERAHIADLAQACAVPFARVGESTVERLAAVLDPGLEPANPLDMWGASARAQWQLTESLTALSADSAVLATALAVDLVPEFDGDRSYPLAVLDAAGTTSKPVVVLCNIPGAIDPVVAAELRRESVPVLEGTRTGLLALRHLLDHATPRPLTAPPPATDPARSGRWAGLLADGPLAGERAFRLLGDYGIAVTGVRGATSATAALAAADGIGYPVVLKTNEPGIDHKSEVAGVRQGIHDRASLLAAYTDLRARLGPAVLVCQSAPAGTELALGIVHDPDLGPLVVVGAGGILVEHFSDRAVALPPVTEDHAERMLRRLRVSALLDGVRGQRGADRAAVHAAIAAVSAIACELGGSLTALDVNPLICGPSGALAADVLVIGRTLGGAAAA